MVWAWVVMARMGMGMGEVRVRRAGGLWSMPWIGRLYSGGLFIYSSCIGRLRVLVALAKAQCFGVVVCTVLFHSYVYLLASSSVMVDCLHIFTEHECA